MAIIFSQQPVAQNKFTGENWTLGASVTGEIKAFIDKPLPSQTLETCVSLHVDTSNNVFVGTGNTISVDSLVFKSTTVAESWLSFAGATPSASFAVAICSNVGGDIFHVANDYATAYTAFCKNGIVQQTIADLRFAFWGIVFGNGNVCFGHQTDSDTAVITVSTSGGVTHTTAISVAANTKFHSAVKINETTAIAVTRLGYVYKTTNSGVSWSYLSQVSATPGDYSLGLLGTRLICSRSGTVAWFQSTNSGDSWYAYTTGAPAAIPYSSIRNYNGTTCFGSLSSPDVYVNVNDASWVKYSINNANLERVYDVAIVNGDILACTGYSAGGDGRVYKYQHITDFKAYKTPSTLVGSSTETDGTCSYTNVADASDVGDYYITATNAGTTITSNTVSVAVSDHLAVTGITGGGDYIEGNTVTITVTHAGGRPPVSVAWYKNAVLLVGYSGDNLVFTTSEATDSGSYYAIVSSLDESIQSDTVIVNVAPYQVVFPMSGHSCEVVMAWEVNKGHNDNFNVYDYGSDYDTYTAEVEYLSDAPYFYDRQAENVAVKVTDHAGGFYPFGSHLLNDVNGFRYTEFKGKVNYFATYYSWDCQLVPAKDSVYTTVSYTFTACSVTGFTFGTLVSFPMPDADPIDEYAKKWNRQTNSFAEYDFGASTEARAVKLKWKDLKNADFAVLMSYILTGVRATQISATFPRIVSPWKLVDGEDFGSFNIRISNPKIKYKQSSGNLWDVSIEVRKCQ